MQRIYIGGAGGMLGQAFYNVLNNKYRLYCTDIDTNEKWLKYLEELLRHNSTVLI